MSRSKQQLFKRVLELREIGWIFEIEVVHCGPILVHHFERTSQRRLAYLPRAQRKQQGIPPGGARRVRTAGAGASLQSRSFAPGLQGCFLKAHEMNERSTHAWRSEARVDASRRWQRPIVLVELRVGRPITFRSVPRRTRVDLSGSRVRSSLMRMVDLDE